MISAGYFSVSQSKLVKLGKTLGLQFLSEMADYGGRISYDEMHYWMNEMGWN